MVRQMARTYLTTNYGCCYTSLNALDNTCGAGIATDYKNIIHARRLVVSETISDGANIQEASTSLEYDNYDPTVTSHAAVVTNTGMTGYQDLFSPYDTRFQPRANETKVTHQIAATHSAVHHGQYDNAGNLVKHVDPNGNATSYSYTDDYGDGSFTGGSQGPNGATFAIPTTVTNALGHQTLYQFDYTRLMPAGVKDPNQVITETTYDVYDRPLTVTAAVGKPEQAIAQYTYESAGNNIATVSTQLDATRWLSTQTVSDGFERPLTVSHNEDGHPALTASFTISSESIY